MSESRRAILFLSTMVMAKKTTTTGRKTQHIQQDKFSFAASCGTEQYDGYEQLYRHKQDNDKHESTLLHSHHPVRWLAGFLCSLVCGRPPNSNIIVVISIE
jgi:hypothetical protein